jgi:hypothetical protein
VTHTCCVFALLTLYSCMEHTLHLSASHFVQALQVPSIMKTNQSLQDLAKIFDNELDFDIDDSTEVIADLSDAEATIDANRTDFTAGDIVGKVLAFVTQVHISLHSFLFSYCI